MTRCIAAVLFVLAMPLVAQTTLEQKARAAINANRPDAAVPLLQAELEQSPSDANAHYLLGVAYGSLAEKANFFRQPSYARHARDEFEHAVQLDPNNLDARFALVQFYTLAPSLLGGSKQKALMQAEEIRRRNVRFGDRALEFVKEGKPSSATTR